MADRLFCVRQLRAIGVGDNPNGRSRRSAGGYSLTPTGRREWRANSQSEYYHRGMARLEVALARIRHQHAPPSGRQRWTRSGGARSGGAQNSVCPGQGEHLGAFSLGEPTPNPVRLVHLQSVSATRDHGRALKTHGLRLCLTAGPGGTSFPFRVEEEGAGHAAARGVQLPVPQISVRAGKAPGIGHFDPLWSVQISSVPTMPGIWARSVTRFSHQDTARAVRSGLTLCGLPRWGRIRADPGTDVDQTLDRFSAHDKTLILFFVDLGEDPLRGSQSRGARSVNPTWCGIAHTGGNTQARTGPWPFVQLRLLSAVVAGPALFVCPNYPLWGPDCRIAESQGSGEPNRMSSVKKSDASSTPSAGGIT